MADVLPRAWEGNVLKALAATGNVRRSAEAAKVSRAFVHEQRVDDSEFAAAWDAALDSGCSQCPKRKCGGAQLKALMVSFGPRRRDQDGQIGVGAQIPDAIHSRR